MQLAGRSRSSRKFLTMDVVCWSNARLLRARMGIRGEIKKGKQYGHDNLDPPVSDHHVTLWKNYEHVFVYPPHSAHQPGVLLWLVSGNILWIHLLCSEQDDIDLPMKEFYARLLVRRYQRDLLITVFSRGITGARAFIKCGSVRKCLPNRIKYTTGRVFFHLKYPPREPNSKSLQHQWLQHLLHPPWEPPLWRLKKHKIPIGIKSMCVAYSRPKNLGNFFTYCKIDRLDGPPVSSYLE